MARPASQPNGRFGLDAVLVTKWAAGAVDELAELPAYVVTSELVGPNVVTSTDADA